MSLFGSLQNAGNTLQAMQIGLQVVGNNIANANTPGFIREQTNYAPAPVQKKGNLQIGLGVVVDSITQKVDQYLGEQLRGAAGDSVSADLRNEAYKDLERLVGELSNTDLSTALTDFFGSINGTTNPQSGGALAARNLAVLEGTQLAGEVQRIDDAARQLRDGYDSQIVQAVSDVNRLAEEIQKLNIRITQTEGGSASKSQAGALRTQRNNALNELSALIDVNAIEQPSGGLSIAIGGEFLVFEGQRREITVLQGSESGLSVARLEFSDTGKELELTKGRVHGLATSRDEIVGGFRERLDSFAKTLIFEFNKTYSQGQGTEGFRSLTSQDAVRDRLAPLDAAGLAFAPENGQFQLIVRNARTGNVKTSDIEVKLVGLDGDTSLDSLAKAIDAVEGIGAAVDANGRLQITSDSTEVQFSFANDTSGALAALGVNTFFTGLGAATIGVNDELQGIQNASKFAAATTDPRTGQRNETGNLVRLTALIDQPLEALGGASIANQYEQTISELAQNSTIAGSVADGLSVYADTLSSEFEATSGVNIDEEAIEMISLQRIYQATARYISTIQEMLDTLVRL